MTTTAFTISLLATIYGGRAIYMIHLISTMKKGYALIKLSSFYMCCPLKREQSEGGWGVEGGRAKAEGVGRKGGGGRKLAD